MKNCPKCGAPCAEKAKFCSTCGVALVAPWEAFEDMPAPDAEAHAAPDPVQEETTQNTYEWQSYQQQNTYQQGGYQQAGY